MYGNDLSMTYVIIGGLVAGIISGAIPLFYGAFNSRISWGILGFIACLISGVLLGLLLSLPIASVFVYLIRREIKSNGYE